MSFTLFRQAGIHRSCLAPERERFLSSESFSSQILTRSIVNLQIAILSTSLRMSSASSTERVTVLLLFKHYTSELLFTLRLLICFLNFLPGTMSKFIQRLYWDLFSSIVIREHIFSLFFSPHKSVSYITEVMDNFDSDTGRHGCNRWFTDLFETNVPACSSFDTPPSVTSFSPRVIKAL